MGQQGGVDLPFLSVRNQPMLWDMGRVQHVPIYVPAFAGTPCLPWSDGQTELTCDTYSDS